LYALFVIPCVLIILLIIILCNCRPINKCLFKRCRSTCCTSRRPGEKSSKQDKLFDATILYSRFDEKWVEDNLEGKAFKISDYNINSVSFEKGFKDIDEQQLKNIHKSKRIILVVSKNFISEVWVNEEFQRKLKLLNSNDKNCSFIVIDMKDASKSEMKRIVEDLQDYSDDACCYSCEQRDKYNFSLKNVEEVNGKGSEVKLKDDLAFLMPFRSIHRKYNPSESHREKVNIFPKNRVAPKANIVKQDKIITDDSISITYQSTMSSLTSASQMNIDEQPTYTTRIDLWRESRVEPDSNRFEFKPESRPNFYGDKSFAQAVQQTRLVRPSSKYNFRTTKPVFLRDESESQNSNDISEHLKVPIAVKSSKSKQKKKEKKSKDKLRYVTKDAKNSSYFVPIYKTNTYNNESSVQYMALPENKQSYGQELPLNRPLDDGIVLPASVYPRDLAHY
jgi:hypothetical protein